MYAKLKSAVMTKIAKKDLPDFEDQNRPEKVKEIYKALKRDHPEYSAGKKARIANAKGIKKEGGLFSSLSKPLGLSGAASSGIFRTPRPKRLVSSLTRTVREEGLSRAPYNPANKMKQMARARAEASTAREVDRGLLYPDERIIQPVIQDYIPKQAVLTINEPVTTKDIDDIVKALKGLPEARKRNVVPFIKKYLLDKQAMEVPKGKKKVCYYRGGKRMCFLVDENESLKKKAKLDKTDSINVPEGYRY